MCARRRRRETPTRAPPWRQRHTSMAHFPLRATEISGSMRAPKELAAEGPAWPAWVWGRARGGRSVGVCIWGVGGAKKAGRSAPVSSWRWHVEHDALLAYVAELWLFGFQEWSSLLASAETQLAGCGAAQHLLVDDGRAQARSTGQRLHSTFYVHPYLRAGASEFII